VNATWWIGLAVMVGSEAATLRHVEPFWTWNTPIAWTGFILFADGIVWRARGHSWLRSNPGEFAFLAIASIGLWLVFEGYNLLIHNWYYTGLPQARLLRYIGYAWSFSTVWPAIFEAAELAAIVRGGKSGEAGRARRYSALPLPALPGFPALSALSITIGALMLASPFVVAPPVARYLAAPVWLGFILLLDPINVRLGGPSLLVDIGARQYDQVINLAVSGGVCGVLWEFWNYWARSKWHYSVPIMSNLKIFEMPLPGYLGFPAFALECFTMYVFVRQVFVGRPGRTIAL
jgi:hypothetical protein